VFATAAPAYPPARRRGPGDREGSTVGPGRGPQGPARRGGRRPGPLGAGHEAGRGGVPDGEDLPGMAAAQGDSTPTP